MASNPIHIPAVFAEGGTKYAIEKTPQVGQPPEAFTWVYGTPNITMNPIPDGGKAPRGQDFNGFGNAICSHIVFNQNGGRYKWSQDVIDNYGGYPAGAIVQSDDETREFRSLANSNTQNPNLSLGSTWVVYAGTGSVPLGTSTVAGLLKVINDLTSTDVASALSAAQGKVLKDLIDTKLNASQALGVGQTWQNVTSSRSIGSTYTNNTGKPIQVNVSWEQANQNESTLFVGSVPVARGRQNLVGGGSTLSAIVPSGSTYRVVSGNSITVWAELR